MSNFKKGDVILHSFYQDQAPCINIYLTVLRNNQIKFIDVLDLNWIEGIEDKEYIKRNLSKYMLTQKQIMLNVDKNCICNKFNFYQKSEDLKSYEYGIEVKILKELTNLEF